MRQEIEELKKQLELECNILGKMTPRDIQDPKNEDSHNMLQGSKEVSLASTDGAGPSNYRKRSSSDEDGKLTVSSSSCDDQSPVENIPKSSNLEEQPPSKRRKIPQIYKTDPYLRAHIEKTNKRQLQRNKEINKMIHKLDSVIPSDFTVASAVRVHSKHGILKRATAYIKHLESLVEQERKIEKSSNTRDSFQ